MQTVQELLFALCDRGLTQAEIASRTGIPQPRLSRWLHGAAPVGADDALRLLRLAEEEVRVTADPQDDVAAPSDPQEKEAEHG